MSESATDTANSVSEAPDRLLSSDRITLHQPRQKLRPRKLSGAQVVELTSQPLAPVEVTLAEEELPNGDAKENAVPTPIDAITSPDNLLSPTSVSLDCSISPTTERHHHTYGLFENRLSSSSIRDSAIFRTLSTPSLLLRNRPSVAKSHESLTTRQQHKPLLYPDPLTSATPLSDRHPSTPALLRDPSSNHVSKFPPPSLSLSLQQYLQLQLDSNPNASFLSRGQQNQEYESSAVKFERLRNFLILPFRLEKLLVFGAACCMDSWLYIFTILPLRFFKALAILCTWWLGNARKELADIYDYFRLGIARVWRRTWQPPPARNDASAAQLDTSTKDQAQHLPLPKPNDIRSHPRPPIRTRSHRHRRTRSTPSLLQIGHKADLLKGALVIITSIVLMQCDPSRIYHIVRGQSTVKLYVIYNALEVLDKLLSAIGQDVLDCLFSREILERNPDGRSKVIQPLWMFGLALLYTIVHSGALLYQTISLNVAVNSYSNALLTLLVSSQFVEIKGAVFKKIEKENLFQLTCADVVERFQLWIMLLIIAMRNMVEVGGLNISTSSSLDDAVDPSMPFTGFVNNTFTTTTTPFSILPSLTGAVIAPFFFVLGSEMLVDWGKHAYVSKFNAIRPAVYSRFLDVLTTDYYSNAFSDQNLSKRIGLPVLPLACLFVRTTIQTYGMFLAIHLPLAIPSSTTALETPRLNDHTASSTPTTAAALPRIDALIRRALGRNAFEGSSSPIGWLQWTSRIFGGSKDDSYEAHGSVTDALTSFLFALAFAASIYFALLAIKMILGMCLLRYSRVACDNVVQRDAAAAAGRERETTVTGARRLGSNGMVEVNDDALKRIYEGDEENLKKRKEKERKELSQGRGRELGEVMRYDMVAKRIW